MRKSKVIAVIATGFFDNAKKLIVRHALIPIRAEHKLITAVATQPLTFLMIVSACRTNHISTVGCMREGGVRAAGTGNTVGLQ
ncbi:MAG: hypothetical protein D3903_05075 [Candidatus Electrothrix sp. GM3_4]|nr:hypothetical protein [Candidatus Electrothrix sp. GM3_4]